MTNPSPRETESLSGFLVVETRADRPGYVRVYPTRETPSAPSADEPDTDADSPHPRLRYAAAFPALHVAGMHAQTALHRSIVDAESGLFRADPVVAAAAVEAIDLAHRRLYLDPKIAADPRFARLVDQRHARQRLYDRIWTLVGILAILVLILFSQIPVFF